MRVSGISVGPLIHTKIEKDIIEEFLPAIKHLACKISMGFENDNFIDGLIPAGRGR